MYVRRNIAKALRIAGPVLSIDGYCASDPCLAAKKKINIRIKSGLYAIFVSNQMMLHIWAALG